MINYFCKMIWVNMQKDLRIWVRQWYNIVAALVMPLTYVLVVWLGAAAVGKNPVALVVQDQGPAAQQVVQALQNADVFRIEMTDATTAQTLYNDLQVAAIVTIPSGFSLEVQQGKQAPIIVKVDNINLDLTNDIRRAVPDGINLYYAQQTPNPLGVVIAEQNLRSQDVEVFQFAIVPMISLLLLAHALISSGISAAREWEDKSVKELLLAPASRSAIILGKVGAGFVSTFGLGLVLFSIGYALGWTQPQGIYLANALLTIALMSLFATGLGIAIGTGLRRIQTVTSLSTTLSVWLFFIAGGIGVIQFEPIWLKQIASFDPLTYGTHALQMATFYSSSDQLGRDAAILAGSAFVMVLLGWIAMRRGIIK